MADRPAGHFDQVVARMSQWCQKHGKRIHIPLKGPIRIENKDDEGLALKPLSTNDDSTI